MSVYSDNNIIEGLNEIFSLSLKIEDLNNITSIRNVYLYWIEDFNGNIENLLKAPSTAPDHVLQYYDSYKDVMNIMRLASAVKHFFKVLCNEDSFAPVDIFAPRIKRTRKFFSEIINVYSYGDEIQKIEDIINKAKERKARKMELENSIALKEQRCMQLKMEGTEFKIKAEQIMERIAEETEKLQELQTYKATLQSKLFEVKNQKSSVMEESKDLQLRLLEKSETIEKLTKQIITPDEKEEFEGLKNSVVLLKEENNLASQRIGELKDRLLSVEKCIEKVNEMMSVLSEIELLQKKKGEGQMSVEGEEKKILAVQEQLEDLSLENQNLEEKLTACKEHLLQLKHSFHFKREGLEEENTQLERNSELLKKENQDYLCKNRELEEKLSNVKQEISYKQKAIKDYEDEVKNKILALEEKAIFEHQQRLKVLKDLKDSE